MRDIQLTSGCTRRDAIRMLATSAATLLGTRGFCQEAMANRKQGADGTTIAHYDTAQPHLMRAVREGFEELGITVQ